MAAEKKKSAKTDAMRAAREAQWKAREEERKRVNGAGRGYRAEDTAPPPVAIDDRVNEASDTDPNGRGGKARINVPKPPKDGGLPKTKADRSQYPVPNAKKAPPKKAKTQKADAPGTVGRVRIAKGDA